MKIKSFDTVIIVMVGFSLFAGGFGLYSINQSWAEVLEKQAEFLHQKMLFNAGLTDDDLQYEGCWAKYEPPTQDELDEVERKNIEHRKNNNTEITIIAVAVSAERMMGDCSELEEEWWK